MRKVPPPKTSNGEMLPLMDMIFLLLVVFIFMIIQMRPDFGIEVNLPDVGKTELSKHNQKLKTTTISVTAENKIFFNANKIPAANLKQEIAKLKNTAGKEKIKIILRGDQKADYGRIINIFNALRSEGLKDILFDVETKS